MDDATSGGQSPPPGWYPDPENPNNRRWWDGLAWSTFSEPLDRGAPPASPGAGGPPGTWQGAAGPMPRTAPNIDTWLWQSIVATVICCMPLGIAGIVFASQAQSELSVGNYDLARRKAGTARTFTLWSVGVTLALIVGWFLLFLVGIASSGVTSSGF